MKNITVQLLNPEVIVNARKIIVLSARLTQRGHNINDEKSFNELYEKPITDQLLKTLTTLPHTNLLKHTMLSVIIIGASRRFLAQITRHQHFVNFTSASCQYSNYSNTAQFVIPLSIMQNNELVNSYLQDCEKQKVNYGKLAEIVGHDDASYLMPQGMRNVLLMSATIQEWRHIISQRTCKRNTIEMRYVMLKVWEQLYNLDSILFSIETCSPFCIKDGICKEKAMSCGKPLSKEFTPTQRLQKEFKEIYE